MTKHRKGYLYKRNDIYQLEYTVNGKRFKQSLKTSKLKEARIERDRIMKPLEMAGEVEALAGIQQRIAAKEDELIKLGPRRAARTR